MVGRATGWEAAGGYRARRLPAGPSAQALAGRPG